MAKPLREYNRKRDFKITSEPGPQVPKKAAKKLLFVVQEHHASHLHYDFRLEWKGVLKSWAVPKGPTLDPSQKRLAVEVEDHPIAYAKFTGTIPEKQYGAGEVYRWDMGNWKPINDPTIGLKKGRLEFELTGDKLKGEFLLIRTRATTSGKNQWLLIKRHDEFAREGQALTSAKTPSKSKEIKKSKTKANAKPQFVPPQLAQLVSHPPEGEDWVHEIKYDGYRTQALIENKKVRLITRGNLDWTAKYGDITKLLSKINVENANIDGELVWQDDNGRSDFQKLQNALKNQKLGQLVFWAFDLLFLDGQDMTSLPLIARKDRLEKLIKKLGQDRIRYSDHFRGVGEDMLQASCKLDLEGVISKRIEMPYTSGRHGEWVKSKCIKRQEFVVGGFTDPEGARTGLGALMLGIYEEGQLRFVGKCGTGFDNKTLRELTTMFNKIEIESSPFEIASPKGRGLHWVKPIKVVEVTFANWTQEKILRVPVFHGLRTDKDPTEITMEKPKPVEEVEKKIKSPKKSKAHPDKTAKSQIKVGKSGVHISHPDRVIYKKEKISKGDVAAYYQEIAQWMLPHLANRPISLLRCPNMKGCFYSKHFTPLPEHLIALAHVKGIDHDAPFFTIDSVDGLLTLVQMGALEIHPWNCHAPKVQNPDQIVMDFDQDPKLDFDIVKQGALELRSLLSDLDLESFVKVTGGKGLHVQFPIEPIYTWDQIKEFSKTLAMEMQSRHPDLYTLNVRKNTRNNKIFLDYLRNGLGSTAVAPYSTRAHESSSIALPIEWSELKTLKRSDQYDIQSALKKIRARKSDPWKDFFNIRQKIKIL